MSFAFLEIIQIVLAAVLVFLILIQSKGTGLYSAFSGSIGFYRSRRGIERTVFILTIVLASFLVINSLLITILI